MKADHERLVAKRSDPCEPVKLVHLDRLADVEFHHMGTGDVLMGMLVNSLSFNHGCPPDLTSAQRALLGDFFQAASDWMDCHDIIGPKGHFEAAEDLDGHIHRLREQELAIYAAHRRCRPSVGWVLRLTGATSRSTPCTWRMSPRRRETPLSRRLDFGEERELPWPRVGDELFAPAEHPWMNAQIRPWGNESYIIGYKAAGDALVERVEEQYVEADTLVFPIVFCFRQYLELLLKDVLSDARIYFDEDEPVPNRHPLLDLWRPLRLLLARRWPDDPTDLDAVENSIQQFDAVDGGSFAFRYATTTSGERSLPDGLQQINLRNLAEVVERIGVFLDACATALMEEHDAADF